MENLGPLRLLIASSARVRDAVQHQLRIRVVEGDDAVGLDPAAVSQVGVVVGAAPVVGPDPEAPELVVSLMP